MDPASIVGLVAACSSLAKSCGTVVMSLHSLAETYKYAELEITSIKEECETIQFAWTQIEEWAGRNLQMMEGFDQLRERLQRSIYSGQLVMSALEEDVTRAIPTSGLIRRRAALAWNSPLFQAHQTRVRGQVNSLQLLLQVMNMPRHDDRVEVLTIREKVFNDADESARSIIPSVLSTRASAVDSDTMSINTIRSLKMKYIPFSFENDLFTSFVYKRNYRVPLFKKSSSTARGGSGRRTRPEQVTESKDFFETGSVTSLSSMKTLPGNPIPNLLDFPVMLPLLHDIDYLDSPQLGSAIEQSFKFLRQSRFSEALWEFSTKLDIAYIFLPSHEISLRIQHGFLCYVLENQQELFTVFMERMAYTIGHGWMEYLNILIWAARSRLPATASERIRKAVETAHNASQLVVKHQNRLTTVLQLAYTVGNQPVVSYLLSVGFRSNEDRDPDHPIILDTEKSRPEIAQLALWLDLSPQFLTMATLPSKERADVERCRWCVNVAKGLVSNSPIPGDSLALKQIHVPGLLNSTINLFQDFRTPAGLISTILGLLQSIGFGLDYSLVEHEDSISIAPLAYAATLGQTDTVITLIKLGAKVFWASMGVYDEARKHVDHATFDAILRAIALRPELRRRWETREGLERMETAIFSGKLGFQPEDFEPTKVPRWQEMSTKDALEFDSRHDIEQTEEVITEED